MKKPVKDPRPLPARLWTFQRERAPLYGVVIMALTTVGAVFTFSDTPARNYFTAALIIMLYLLQIRTADEKKDFEHDNIYHPDRPVQRGVVSLAELAVVNKIAVISQPVLYASFLDPRILALGLASQGYAYLTRKEFFVRDWIRQHFFTYYFLHYIQLVILFYAMSAIVQPVGVSNWVFVLLCMCGVITTELGRKMYPVEKDTIDDTYSAQLGHRGSAVTVSVLAGLFVAAAFYLIHRGDQNYLFIIGPVAVLGLLINNAYHYAVSPHIPEAKHVELTSNILYVVTMLSVILGG
jgi:hypothetical protein